MITAILNPTLLFITSPNHQRTLTNHHFVSWPARTCNFRLTIISRALDHSQVTFPTHALCASHTSFPYPFPPTSPANPHKHHPRLNFKQPVGIKSSSLNSISFSAHPSSIHVTAFGTPLLSLSQVLHADIAPPVNNTQPRRCQRQGKDEAGCEADSSKVVNKRPRQPLMRLGPHFRVIYLPSYTFVTSMACLYLCY